MRTNTIRHRVCRPTRSIAAAWTDRRHTGHRRAELTIGDLDTRHHTGA